MTRIQYDLVEGRQTVCDFESSIAQLQSMIETIDFLRCDYSVDGNSVLRVFYNKKALFIKEMHGITAELEKLKDDLGTFSSLFQDEEEDFSSSMDISTGNFEQRYNQAVQGVNGEQDVIHIQALLSVIGMPIGQYGPNMNGVDGDYGSKCVSAVKMFQLMEGIEATGEWDETTLARLEGYAESGMTYKGLIAKKYKEGFRPSLDADMTLSERANILYYYAVIDESSSGVPAAVTVSQGLLESQAGKYVPVDTESGQYSFNLFGIKANKNWREDGNDYVTCLTQEYENGQYITISSYFRCYDNYLESVNDHSRFLEDNQRYLSLFDIEEDALYFENWTTGLMECGYATDPEYDTKLMGIINSYNFH